MSNQYFDLSRITPTENAIMISLRGVFIIGVSFLFIACLLKRHRQPLKSRGMVPFFFIIGETFQSILFIVIRSIPASSLNLEIFCWIVSLLLFPIRWIIPMVVADHTFRYLMLSNFQRLKNNLVSRSVNLDTAKIDEKRMKTRMKFYQFIASPFGMIVKLSVPVLIWITIILILVYTQDGGKCVLSIGKIIAWMSFMGAAFALLMVEAFWDLISTYLQTKKHGEEKFTCKLYMWDNDAYFFRIEFTAVRLWMFFLLITVITLGISMHGALILHDIISLVFEIILMIINPGISLMMTIVWDRRGGMKTGLKSKKDMEDDILDFLLENDLGRELFSKFAAKEWSLENVTIMVKILKRV